jgi:DNA-binding NarL/FixJ family response regulator
MKSASLPLNLYAPNARSASTVSSTAVRSTRSTRSTQSNAYIHIVSNSHLLHEALILFLNKCPTTDLVHRHTSEDPVPLSLENASRQLVLLDSGIGHELAMRRIQQWRSLDPAPYVVVLEVKQNDDLILALIESGAHAYALQGASSGEIRELIEQVYQGTFQCSPEITAKLFARLSQPKAKPESTVKPLLTHRELEVLYYVEKEYSDRAIATQLTIEVRTVKHHVHNSLQKLNVRYRRDAAQLALQNGWLDAFG